MLQTLDHTIRIGSTPTFLYFELYLYSACAAHYVYLLENKAVVEFFYQLRCVLRPRSFLYTVAFQTNHA